MKKYISLLICIPFFAASLKGQGIPEKLKQAVWVKIMADESSYNYLEAESAFQKYYSSYLQEKYKEEARETPVNPSHAGEEHMKSPVELLIANYQKWSIQIKPFVRSDGSIIPLPQRLAIISDTRNRQQAR